MWRAIVLATGISLCILGAEFMVVDRLMLHDANGNGALTTETLTAWNSTASRRVFVPPEWAPWGLVSGGVVVILYSSAISGRSEE